MKIRNCTCEILTELLDRRGVKLSELSRATGVPRECIRGWLSGKTPKADWQVVTVAGYFRVSVTYLLYGLDHIEYPKAS